MAKKPKPAASTVKGEVRAIQTQVAKSDKKAKTKVSGTMQAAARIYPEPPFARQHQLKPGIEARFEPAPMFSAPYY